MLSGLRECQKGEDRRVMGFRVWHFYYWVHSGTGPLIGERLLRMWHLLFIVYHAATQRRKCWLRSAGGARGKGQFKGTGKKLY